MEPDSFFQVQISNTELIIFIRLFFLLLDREQASCEEEGLWNCLQMLNSSCLFIECNTDRCF